MFYLAYLFINGNEKVFNVFNTKEQATMRILEVMYGYLPGFNLERPGWTGNPQAAEAMLVEYTKAVENHPLKFAFKIKEVNFNFREW